MAASSHALPLKYVRRLSTVKKIYLAILGVFALAIILAVSVSTATPAEAVIDEIVAALCNGGDPLEARGQVRDGKSFLRALQATGFITDIDGSVAGQVTISFDPTVPSSKFRDAGVGDVVIPNGIAPGVNLILSPGIEPDPDFPAHANCPLFPPSA